MMMIIVVNDNDYDNGSKKASAKLVKRFEGLERFVSSEFLLEI